MKFAAELATSVPVAPAIAVRRQVPAVTKVTRPEVELTVHTVSVVLAKAIVPPPLPAAKVW